MIVFESSFGTQRNTMTGLNIVVFTKGHLIGAHYIPGYVDTKMLEIYNQSPMYGLGASGRQEMRNVIVTLHFLVV